MNEDVKDYLARIGRKGGKKTSETKAEACRDNASKPRKKQSETWAQYAARREAFETNEEL